MTRFGTDTPLAVEIQQYRARNIIPEDGDIPRRTQQFDEPSLLQLIRSLQYRKTVCFGPESRRLDLQH